MKNKKGITLVELVIALAILGLLFSVAGRFFIPVLKTPPAAMEEYEVQASTRLLAQQINSTIRDASATFALHRVNHNNLTAGWNYIIPSLDKTSITEYKWNGSAHVARLIAITRPGITYDLTFVKKNPASSDNLLEYNIAVHYDGQLREIKSEVEALNSLQVIDRGSTSFPANTLAYRTDPRPTEISDTQAAVTMVLDISGSMAYRMDGNTSSNDNHSNPAQHSRMKKMKTEAQRLLQGLADNPNIYAGIVPFGSHANNPSAIMQVKTNVGTGGTLTNIINGLSVATGNAAGTNTGDGLRRAYHIQRQFNETATATVKNFMIILVDGVTTFSSATRVNATRHGSSWSGYTYTINSLDYVLGDSSINDFWIQSGNYNTNYPNGAYTGLGNSLDSWGTQYVTQVGNMIEAYGVTNHTNKEPFQVYVVGFSAVSADYGSLNAIGSATSAEINPATGRRYFEADDSAALQAIFEAIEKDINDSLWHIGGPN